MRTIFLDRDGVINENRPDHVKSWDEFHMLPGVATALRWLRIAGFRVFVVTNQAIVGRGIVPRSTIDEIHARMAAQIELSGGWIHDLRYCPHDNADNCQCRKPQPGMLLDLMKHWKVEPQRSYMVGDAVSDVQAGKAAGVQTILVRTGRGMAQAKLCESQQTRPDHIASDLLAAVGWVFRAEGLTLPASEPEPLRQRAVGGLPVPFPMQY